MRNSIACVSAPRFLLLLFITLLAFFSQFKVCMLLKEKDDSYIPVYYTADASVSNDNSTNSVPYKAWDPVRTLNLSVTTSFIYRSHKYCQ